MRAGWRTVRLLVAHDAPSSLPMPWRKPVGWTVRTIVGTASDVEVAAGSLVATGTGVDEATAVGADVADDTAVAAGAVTVDVTGTAVGDAPMGVAVPVISTVADGVRAAVATVVGADAVGVSVATVTEEASGVCVGTGVVPADGAPVVWLTCVTVGATVLLVVGDSDAPAFGVAVVPVVERGEAKGVAEKVAVATVVGVGVTVDAGAVNWMAGDEALTRPPRSYATTTAL